jgi:hypothetical protein
MYRTENIVYNNTSIVACVFVAAETCLLSHYLVMNVCSGSTIPVSGIMSQIRILVTSVMAHINCGLLSPASFFPKMSNTISEISECVLHSCLAVNLNILQRFSSYLTGTYLM